jgi:dTDP-4-dehydrorhamnose reductase
MLRILLIGNSGQLGWELERALTPIGDVVGLDYPVIDLTNKKSVRQTVRKLSRLNLIINAAAYTAVDRAESEYALASAINGKGPGILAEEARRMQAAFIHYSTDYVFDGTKGRPYVETDAPNPLGVYGTTKLAGERAVKQAGGSYLILRTAWLYSLRGDSFVSKVLHWARKEKKMRIVSDQISNPTWARSLAGATARIMDIGGDYLFNWIGDRAGTYHLAGDGYASRFEFARQILQLDPDAKSHAVQELLPATTADFCTPAKRPLFSALNCEKFENVFGFRLSPWRDALCFALQRDQVNGQ